MTNFQMNVKLFKHCECMKTNYLFPEKCKTIGWILILFGLVTAILSNEDMLPNLGPTKAISLIPSEKTSFEEGEKVEKTLSFITQNDDWADEIANVAIMVGFILVSFTRLKEEDEYTINLRLKTFSWAVKVYGILFILTQLTVYGTGYLLPLLYFHWLIFPLFIGKFYYEIWKFRKEVVSDEE